VQVFISWSGTTSKAVAGILRHHLELAFPTVKWFMSAEDLGPGVNWSARLNDAMTDARIAIVCLAPDNLNSPWIVFESGAVAHALGKNLVIPYLHSVVPAEVDGPLAQFQAVQSDEEGTRRLFRVIAGATDDSRQRSIDEVFAMFWPRISESLGVVPQVVRAQPTRTDRSIFEEMLALLRRQARNTTAPPKLDAFWTKRWKPEDFANRSVEEIEHFFATKLWPKAKDKAYRNWDGVNVNVPFENERLEARETALAIADKLGLRTQWDAWFPRRPTP
jgi:hypothetical protein